MEDALASSVHGAVVGKTAHGKKRQGKAAHGTQKSKEFQKIALASPVGPHKDVQLAQLKVFEAPDGFETLYGYAIKAWHVPCPPCSR